MVDEPATPEAGVAVTVEVVAFKVADAGPTGIVEVTVHGHGRVMVVAEVTV